MGSSKFHISHSDYARGFSTGPCNDKICVKYVGADPSVIGAIFSTARLSDFDDDYDSWAEANYWYQDWLYTVELNEDRADNIAHAIISESFKVDNGTYRRGDLISGSDWDNDGRIDVFENNTYFNYNMASLSMR